MNTQTIEINGKAYKVGFSFRGLREFEILSGKSTTEINGTWDNLMFFYCTLKALNKEFTFTVDEFVEYMDAHPDLFIQFQTETYTQPEPQPEPKPDKKKVNLSGLWMLSGFVLALWVLAPIISGIVWILTSLVLLPVLIAKGGKWLVCRFWP